jgi:hypothetical protein
MATRSPWRDLKIPIRFGSELPPLLRHDSKPTSLARRPLRPVANQPGIPKPVGGLWTAPALLPKGKWRPIPRRSTWTEWCQGDGMETWINYGWQTQIFPEPSATFAVINSAADAVALYEAFPNDDDPVRLLLRSKGVGAGIMDKMIDWQALLNSGVAGVYLTDRGQIETRLPDQTIVPSLYSWDLATVWFGRKAFRVGKTWPSPRLPVDPEDDLPPAEYFRRSRERLRELTAELSPAAQEEPEK